MKIFRIDKNSFRKNELLSWAKTVLIIAIFYFGIKFFFQITHERLVMGIIVVLLLKISDRLTHYHVTSIQVDRNNNQLTFVLNSIMSGEKKKQYNLDDADSLLKNNNGLKKYFTSPYILEIFIKPKDTFLLTDRNGFSFETLTQMDKSIRNKNI